MSNQQSSGVPPIPVGCVINVRPEDYCYGAKPLRLRVIHIGDGANTPGLEWLTLIGVELLPSGALGSHRRINVRVSALRRAGAIEYPRNGQ